MRLTSTISETISDMKNKNGNCNGSEIINSIKNAMETNENSHNIRIIVVVDAGVIQNLKNKCDTDNSLQLRQTNKQLGEQLKILKKSSNGTNTQATGLTHSRGI